MKDQWYLAIIYRIKRNLYIFNTMKKLTIILFTGLLYFSQSAQTAYNKMLVADTTTWQHFGMIYGVKNASTQPINANPNAIAAIDTVTIGGKLYKKVYELSVPAYLNYSGKVLIGYTREDTLTRKVFFKENIATPEFVLYDFSLNVNDSMMINFNLSSYSGYYRVDSIITKTELCGPRKHFFMRKHVNNFNPGFYYYEFIESIGSTYHFLYPYNNGQTPNSFSLTSGCVHKWTEGLACKKNKNSQQYQSCTYNSPTWNSFSGNNCVYFYFVGGLEENSLVKQVSLYPNPANAKITLSFYIEKNETLTIKIVDILGKVVQSNNNTAFISGQNTFELTTAHLESGVYSIVLENKGFKSTHPLIIQK